MKIVGYLQACNFLLWRECFDHYCELVDELYVCFDTPNTSDILREYITNHPKVVKTIDRVYVCDGWLWRETLLRLLDSANPDIVITLDIDEQFESIEAIKKEIADFWVSDKKAMMCKCNPCPTISGKPTVVYPTGANMNIFKWSKDLTYKNYCGYAQITNYANKKNLFWEAKTKINHYCMWTPEMEKAKIAHALKQYGML